MGKSWSRKGRKWMVACMKLDLADKIEAQDYSAFGTDAEPNAWDEKSKMSLEIVLRCSGGLFVSGRLWLENLKCWRQIDISRYVRKDGETGEVLRLGSERLSSQLKASR